MRVDTMSAKVITTYEADIPDIFTERTLPKTPCNHLLDTSKIKVNFIFNYVLPLFEKYPARRRCCVVWVFFIFLP